VRGREEADASTSKHQAHKSNIMKTETTLCLSADITATLDRSGADYLKQIIIASANLDDYDLLNLNEETGRWELGFDSLSNRKRELSAKDAALLEEGASEYWSRPDYKAWEVEMTKLVSK
jgi:hypothetical protein